MDLGKCLILQIQFSPMYSPRLIDETLEKMLKAFGAVNIVGPKYCGKTTTASRHSKSILYLQSREHNDEMINLAINEPKEVLKGDNPRLIDEWQIVPQLWDTIRYCIDEKQEFGLFILTGSTIVDRTKKYHSGTGRIVSLKMRTMSSYESGDSDGKISLKDLFKGENKVNAKSDKSLEEIAKILVRGGWPQSVNKDEEISHLIVSGYCEDIIRAETYEQKLDAFQLRKLMRSLSRNTSYPLKKSSLMEDTGLSEYLLNEYLEYLHKIYLLEEIESWNPNLRSKTAIRTSPIIHFCDPAVSAYFLNATPNDLMKDLKTFGLLFESLVIRDLRTYVENIGGNVYHYRDKNGLEVDAILHLNNGNWCAIEIKLGHNMVDDAAKSLQKLKNKAKDSEGEPKFLAVIVPNGIGYTREDGIHVIPITSLKP